MLSFGESALGHTLAKLPKTGIENMRLSSSFNSDISNFVVSDVHYSVWHWRLHLHRVFPKMSHRLPAFVATVELGK